jgi:hypothetical protein
MRFLTHLLWMVLLVGVAAHAQQELFNFRAVNTLNQAIQT